jgi:hypothetical protein
MMNRARIRQLLLVIVSLTLMAMAVMGLVDPWGMAATFGYSFASPDGLSEFFAVYVGMHAAFGGIALLAAYRTDLPLLGDLVAATIVAEGVARLLGIAVAGVPGIASMMNLLPEFMPLVILFLRPRPQPSAVSSGRMVWSQT